MAVTRVRARPLVLHVVESFAAGTERHVIDLIRHVDQVGHVVAAPSVHQGRSTSAAIAVAEAAGARVESIEMCRSRSPRRQTAALSALRGLIRRTQPDIIHGHSSIGGAFARLAALGTGVPVVYTPHGLSRARWAMATERLLKERTNRMIAVSESERDFAIANGVVPRNRVVVIRNGVDSEPPPPLERPLRSSLGLAETVPLIGCVGRLTWQKAPEVFVAASEIVSNVVPEARFVLIGAGLLRELVERAVTEAQIDDRFHLIPSLPNAAAALGELDVFALPSRFEGGPYTPLEAMRARTPVVVTDVAGSRDLVDNEFNGLVVNPDRPDELAAAIVRLLRNPDLRSTLARNGTHTVARHHVRRMAIATAALYAELARYPTPPLSAKLPEQVRVGAYASLP